MRLIWRVALLTLFLHPDSDLLFGEWESRPDASAIHRSSRAQWYEEILPSSYPFIPSLSMKNLESFPAAIPDASPQGDSLNMRLVGRWPFGPSYAIAMDREKEVAFLGSGSAIYVLDVRAPENPLKLAEIETAGMVGRIIYRDGYLYVLTGDRGLRILSMIDFNHPLEVGAFVATGWMKDFCLSGDYAYIIEYNDFFIGEDGRVRVISIEDPENPFELGYYQAPDWAYGIAVDGDYAYIADSFEGLRILSIADPSDLYEVGYYDSPGFAYRVAVEGSYAYLLNGDEPGLRIISIDDPQHPFEVSSLDIDGWGRIVLNGPYAYVVSHSGGSSPGELMTVSIQNPLHPVMLGYNETLRPTEDIALHGEYALVASHDSGLQVFSVSDPEQLTCVGSFDTPGHASDTAVSDSYVYVADGIDGLKILSIEDIENPMEVASYQTPGYCYSVALRGALAYVAAGEVGLRVISVADPLRPIEVGFCDTPGNCGDVVVRGSFAYVLDAEGGFRIISLEIPTHPFELGHCGIWGSAVAVKDSYAYVTDIGGIWGGLHAVSIEDPRNPVEVSLFTTDDAYMDMAMTDSLICVATAGDYFSGLRVFSIADPANPREIGRYDTGGFARGIDASGNLAYVTESSKGIRVISLLDPKHPKEIGYYDAPGSGRMRGVSIMGSYAIVADPDAGIFILQHYEVADIESPNGDVPLIPKTLSLSQNFPNPFNPMTRITFDVPQGEHAGDRVLLDVFDMRGRHVVTLFNQHAEPGNHQVVWDGRDAGGSPVSSGAYLYSLHAGEDCVTRKMTVLR
jgi:hypothetical protein